MPRVVHYLNQFFAGLGGEDRAGEPPARGEGPLGPGRLLEPLLGADAPIVATIYCGDTYFAEREADATAAVLRLIAAERPDLFIAGPAFGAGRYGIACGALCRAVTSALGIPVLTGMSASNPGAGVARHGVPVVATAASAREMTAALEQMAAVGRMLLAGQPLDPAAAEHLLPRGGRRNVSVERPGAERALDMLLAKLAGGLFETEIPLPALEAVPPAPPVRDLRVARLALVTTGGLVPRGNPDRMKSYLCNTFGTYDLRGVDDLRGEAFESIHGGFLTAPVNEDPDRLVPVDVLRELVREGAVGALHEAFFTTVGNGTRPETARRLGHEIAKVLRAEGVDGVLLSSA